MRRLFEQAGLVGILCFLFLLSLTLPGWAGDSQNVDIQVFAPKSGDVAGIGGRGFLVDLVVKFQDTTLAQTGAGLELTGPGAHANAPPFPGAFGAGKNDKFPGLIVLLSTAALGPGQNLSGLFNIIAVTNRRQDDIDIWATWIVGAANFGTGESTLLVALVDDLNGNEIFDDAPNMLTDLTGDGVIDEKDLKQLGVASSIKKVKFIINGQP